jgi:hypothetical protein
MGRKQSRPAAGGAGADPAALKAARNALVTMLILLGPAIEDSAAGKDV